MTESTYTPMRKLPGAPDTPLPLPEHKARAGFLRHDTDDNNQQRVGFNLRTGHVSATWRQLTLGEWEEPEGLDDDADFATLRSLHTRADNTHAEMAQTLQGLYADNDLDNDTRLQLAAKVIEPKLNALATAAETGLAQADARLAEEEAELADALRPRDVAVSALHSDIRQYWKDEGAKPNGKTLIASLLLGKVDDDTLIAIASAPAYMTGITERLHAQARDLLAKRLAPDRVARITALRTGKARALQALAALDRAANHLIDFNKAKTLDAKARAARTRHGLGQGAS